MSTLFFYRYPNDYYHGIGSLYALQHNTTKCFRQLFHTKYYTYNPTEFYLFVIVYLSNFVAKLRLFAQIVGIFYSSACPIAISIIFKIGIRSNI